MLANLVFLSVLLAGQALVAVEASERHPMGVMRRRFDWVFDDPEFWRDFDEWRRERAERGRQRERERERGHEKDHERDHERGREKDRDGHKRDHERRRERDRNEPDYPPEMSVPPEEIQIIPAPSLILPTMTPTSTYMPTTSSVTYTPTPQMTTTAKQMPRKSSEVPVSVAYTTVPESTVYTSVTGRLRAMSNSAGNPTSGITTFIVLVVASATLTLML